MAEELGEKTEQPTGKKLSDARSRGQVAKSLEFGASLDILGALILLFVLGPGLVTSLTQLMALSLRPDRLGPGGVGELPAQLLWIFSRSVLIAGPFLVFLFLIAAAAQFVQVGRMWTFKPLRPKFSQLNPLNGAKKLFGRRNIVKTAFSLLKLAVVISIVYSVVSARIRPLAFLPSLSLLGALTEMGGIVYDLVLWVLSLMLIIGVSDFFYQRWQRIQDLKMTKQEVKEERKSVEGDEATKRRRLGLARSQLMQQIREGVKSADVVVTNPTHFAVAVKYDPDSMHAPKVVAKGADFMAFRIREMAGLHGIPIVEKPPLARALYAGVDVGRFVSPEFYQSIAEILAYVYRLRQKAA